MAGRQRHEEHPARKKLAGIVTCLKRGANDLHMVQLMPLQPHHPEWMYPSVVVVVVEDY